MNDSTCPRPCLMKLDLQSSTNKLAFLKDNWPSFGQIESIDRLSETELRCTLCLLDVVLAALAKDECFCPNREIIRLVLTRTYVQNRCELCETEEIRSKLVKGFCTREKKNGLSRKNNIRRRGISVFYGAILRMLSLLCLHFVGRDDEGAVGVFGYFEACFSGEVYGAASLRGKLFGVFQTAVCT